MKLNALTKVFGRVLRNTRQDAGLSQEALALAADIDRTFVSQIERGIKQPSLTTLYKLADALGTVPSVLLANTEKLIR
jgi:transcriptional regulator with XRE-family HTH domain